MDNDRWSFVGFLILSLLLTYQCQSVFNWIKGDNHSKVQNQIDLIENSNCRAKSKADLTLPRNTVSQIPKFNELRSKIYYKNRTSLVQMHNMALNRAMFYSYIMQKLNSSESFLIQPNWLQIGMSVTADMNGNKDIFNGSMVAFDNNCYYPNWMTNLNFNNTLPLFAAKSWRADDTFDMGVFLREPTGRTNVVKDLGSGANMNYTNEAFKMSPWYKFWLPDLKSDEDSTLKFTYSVKIKYSNVTGKFIHDEFETTNFFGPNSPGQSDKDERLLPVRFTDPYFDCGNSNYWVLSAAAPIVDYMPRYSNFTHLRRPRFVGVVTMDMHFQEIDYNSCPASIGNPGPCHLCGVARCKTVTTGCKHKSGRGFRRGSYICQCKSGHHYPWDVKGPYLGTDLEKATEEEYIHSYECIRTDFLRVPPVVENTEPVSFEGGSSGKFQTEGIQRRALKSVVDGRESLERVRVRRDENEEKEKKKKRRKRSTNFDEVAIDKMMKIFKKKAAVTKDNCHTMSPSALELPGSVAYGADKQFEMQARMALRISHFISNFMQNTAPDENFGYMKGGGRLHYEHLFGEVIANVMSDFKIVSSGIFYEPYVFEDINGKSREFFGPLAYKADGNYYAIDTAGLKERYTDADWYRVIKERWQTNTKGVLKYRMKNLIRSDINGTSTIKHEHYPMGYWAPSVGDGYWTRPVFKCDGRVDDWVVTYVVPFIGKNGIKKTLHFKGMVTVDVPLDYLDINQCTQPFAIANAFKNTARCDYRTQTCSQISGYKFTRGNYKCACKRGFEYPFKDGREWVQGSLIELEYQKKQQGLFNLYDAMRCRVSGASGVSYSVLTIAFLIVVSAANMVGLL
ncbi:uncharacterized protein LOC110452602 [Mizuhopecten yessoensis]|uniref:G-protein coupled receptor 158 n=1 Tax=Mizuhopecten yessoensis TaxID=6573 RepID=A0A210QJ68_MIZYE|nr:uncharacterized protein LOC110452602 [Mizuhopecten yessoensis]OWF48814.1 G-protein coupled receptor 158 [Mizuhopecten yessoensis]